MLVIALNKTLQIYHLTDTEIKTVLFKYAENGYLQLHEEFEDIWKEQIWPIISEFKTNQILFLIGDKATFTNSRVVFIWLNSLATFAPGKYKLAKKLERKVDFDLNPDELLANLEVLKYQVEWVDLLDSEIYSREPTINK